MQSFKQYLSEETSNECTLECCYYFPFTVKGSEKLTKALIRKSIAKLFKGFKYSIENVGIQSFNIKIKNPDSNLLKSKANQFKFHGKIMEAVCNTIGENYIDIINNQLFQTYCNIYINYIPTFPVYCEYFRLTITPNTKFAGLEKVLDCFQLHLIDLEQYKGGLLSLLKLKPSISIRLLNFNKRTFPILGKAWDIIQKHLSSKNRDVIACQEELIDADLKDFAEL